MKTDDLRIVKTHPLLSPAILAEEIPLSEAAAEKVQESRRAVEAVLDGKDGRLVVVVGPCSIHDTRAALEYASKLKPLADALGAPRDVPLPAIATAAGSPRGAFEPLEVQPAGKGRMAYEAWLRGLRT